MRAVCQPVQPLLRRLRGAEPEAVRDVLPRQAFRSGKEQQRGFDGVHLAPRGGHQREGRAEVQGIRLRSGVCAPGTPQYVLNEVRRGGWLVFMKPWTGGEVRTAPVQKQPSCLGLKVSRLGVSERVIASAWNINNLLSTSC